MTEVPSKLQIKKSIEQKIRKQRTKERLVLWSLVALCFVVGSSMVLTNPSVKCGLFLVKNDSGQVMVTNNVADALN